MENISEWSLVLTQKVCVSSIHWSCVCITCLVEVVVLPFSEIMFSFLNKVDEFVIGSVLGVVFYFNFINIDIGVSWILYLCYVALVSINISTIFFGQ